VIYWITVSIIYSITRYGAIEFDLNLVDNVGLLPDDIISAFLFGLIAGILLGLFESFESVIYKKRKSFSFVLITKTIIYIFIFWLGSSLQIAIEDRSMQAGLGFILTPVGLIALLNFGIYSFLFHLVRLMNKSMGPGILFEYLIGKYFNPREEDRIFLFIDLKSSTTNHCGKNWA
jgi:adenylate cyclase